MTGLECLKEEMKARGLLKSQIESRTTVAVLEILSESGGRYTDMDRLENEIHDLEMKKARIEREVEAYRRKVEDIRQKYGATIDLIDRYAQEKYDRTVAYINRFMKALENMETPEGRDKLKIAQTFVNTAKVDTKYDNTAFIAGLAAILARAPEMPLDKLKEINPDIIQKLHVDKGQDQLVEAEYIGEQVVKRIPAKWRMK